MRITWTDNRRCHVGVEGGCQWEIRIDGVKCSNELTYAYYSGHSNLNLHHSETVVGTCFALESGPLNAGSHTIEIWIARVPNGNGFYNVGSFHTGWQSYWSIEAEEVR